MYDYDVEFSKVNDRYINKRKCELPMYLFDYVSQMLGGISKGDEEFGYILPWQAITISIIVVYILVSLIMYVSVNKINKQNIIETIRNDNI